MAPIDRSPRRAALVCVAVLAAAALLAACTATAENADVVDEETAAATAATASEHTADQGAREQRLERLIRSSQIACNPARRFNAIRTGAGPLCAPFDSIPVVDDPAFAPAGEGATLGADEPVIALAVEGEHRAYPIRYLIFHEVVNDEIAGTPIVVSFCPLCNSAVAHDRRLGERTLTFGVSGQLAYANLVMFDRETLTFWQQMTGLATQGELADGRLRQIPVQLLSFGAWRAAHPEGLVLQPPDEGAYPYGSDPYGGYDRDPAEQSPVLLQSAGPVTDTRLSPKWRIVGAVVDDVPIAFAVPEGAGGMRVIEERVEGVPLVAFFEHGTIEAETDRELENARRGWAGSVWIASHDGRELAFELRDGEIVESETGSTFDLLGRGQSGELEGVQLEAPPQLTSFWFSWVHFYSGSLLASHS